MTLKMKKVLILSASPRKGGNSDILCDRFAAGAKENGNTVEKIFLADRNIGFAAAAAHATARANVFSATIWRKSSIK